MTISGIIYPLSKATYLPRYGTRFSSIFVTDEAKKSDRAKERSIKSNSHRSLA